MKSEERYTARGTDGSKSFYPDTKEIIDDLSALMSSSGVSHIKTEGFCVMSAAEEATTRPSHYHSAPFDVTEVQEYVFANVLKALPENRKAAAGWVLIAMKHLLRAGLKDDVFLELQKAENYLHRARTMEWIKE